MAEDSGPLDVGGCWRLPSPWRMSYTRSAVGMEIFRRRGGFTDIGGGWTAIGGVERSWTPVAWLPAGVVFFLADRFAVNALAGAGLVLALCGSIAAGVLFRQGRPRRVLFGRTQLRPVRLEALVSRCSSGSGGSRYRSRCPGPIGTPSSTESGVPG